jgi:predicted nucleic acid-binding protein
MVVVDSSAWIEFLKPWGTPVHRTLRRLLDERAELAVTEIVLMEVLAGARSEAERATVRSHLLALPVLPLNGLADYESAAELYSACLRAGEAIRKLTDCLVAVPVIQAGATLLHNDVDFDVLARHSPLQLEPVAA